MELNQLVERTPSWLIGEGEYPELVVSSRARLARNLAKYKFTSKLTDEEKEKLLNEVIEALKTLPTLRDAQVIKLENLKQEDIIFLIERHLLSVPQWGDLRYTGILYTEDEALSIIINEEDHLRIQILAPALSIDSVYERALKIGNMVGEIIDYAYRDDWGFLTACPTNTGTGLRLSVLLHLPGVIYSKQLEGLLKNLEKVKVTVRGLYGEGSEVQGNIFQLSSVVSLGMTEDEIKESFKEVVKITIDFEKKAREILVRKMKGALEDRIYRSLAILKNARLLSFRETAEHVSSVRLGVGLGYFLDIKVKTLNELLFFSQPMHLQKLFGKTMTPEERDEKRAFYVKTKLGAG